MIIIMAIRNLIHYKQTGPHLFYVSLSLSLSLSLNNFFTLSFHQLASREYSIRSKQVKKGHFVRQRKWTTFEISWEIEINYLLLGGIFKMSSSLSPCPMPSSIFTHPTFSCDWPAQGRRA
ncbi:unnamed protein product [Prunus brigantina]